MNNIPMFTGVYGAASLILMEIPYTGESYAIFRSVQPGMAAAFAEECVQFCRMAGAQRVYASGEDLKEYPFHCQILSMACAKEQILPGEGLLWPVLPENVAKYRELYNEKMKDVHNAATMTWRDEKRLVESGGGYFVHDGSRLLGIGQVSEDRLETVIAAVPGRGETVLRALAQEIRGDTVHLQVASTNQRALRLYRRMGFVPTGVVSTWYRIQ